MTLLEREAELDALEAAVREAAEGGGGLVLIEGPGGIGKSGLLAGLREQAAGRLQVLSARASELEREFAYGVVRQLFETEVAERGASGAAAPAAAVFAAAPPADAEAGASFAALHGLYWLALDLAAEQPLLLAVDDLHWCDGPSLRFLAYLARRLEGVPVLVATTLRSGEPGADPALLADIAQDPATRVLHPSPLGSEAVAAIVRERLGENADHAFCEACHRATAGNPLLLRQLLRTLEAEGVEPTAAHATAVRSVGPRAVATTVLLRLARLGADARAVARAVSVLEPSAELPLVAELAGIAEDAVANAAAALVRAEILRPEPPLGFVHPLVRDAVYHELAPGERELQHERAAAALRTAGAGIERIAAQLLAAPRRGEPWVAQLLMEAALAALGKGAGESAAAYLRRALEEPPPPERETDAVLALGHAEALTNGPAAAEALRRAYAMLDDPVARGGVAAALTVTLMFTRRADEGVSVAREAAASLAETAELADLADYLRALESACAFFGASDADLRARLHAHRLAPPPGLPGAAALAAIAAIEWSYAGGHRDEVAELALAAVRGGGLFSFDNGPVAFGATIMLILADRDEAVELLEGALADARRRGSVFSVGAAHSWLGFALLRRGDLTGAEAMLREGAELTESWGVSRSAAAIHPAFLTEVMLERGAVAAARAALERGDDSGDESDSARWIALARLRVLAAEGRHDDALAAAREISERFAWVTNPAASGWRGPAAAALARLGRHDEAIAYAEEELELARRWGAPGTVGRALRGLAALQADGLPLLEEAAAALEGSPARLEHARALAALGAALRRDGRPGEAREPLRRALELAEACDATALAEHARTELYASGARPRSGALAGVAALTASERRVAGLAAAGQTNREIAQGLFVTPKTVEVHLSNAYRKLGIRSRRELERALA